MVFYVLISPLLCCESQQNKQLLESEEFAFVIFDECYVAFSDKFVDMLKFEIGKRNGPHI